jgi:phosphoribosylanthranilate isomerase
MSYHWPPKRPTTMTSDVRFQDFIQVAGVTDEPEARLLVECGVRFLGFPLRLPVHIEDLSEDEAATIIRSLRPPLYGVVITYLDDANEIVALTAQLGANIVQLHGGIELDELQRLRYLRPDLAIIKGLVIGRYGRGDLIETVATMGPHVDAFITDTFDPVTGASGATGKTHDWSISREIVEVSQQPVILAGGLTPVNVKDAIREVRPAGVDVHTGVEDASGRKDRVLIETFLAEAKAGFREIGAAANRIP